MTAPAQQPSVRAPSVTAGILALIVLIGLGAFLIDLYISKERERDLHQWESRLSLIADTRMDSIQRWLGARFDDLRELSDNASLQLYLWQIEQGSDDGEPGVEPAQLTYLRNLILATADRTGYLSDDTPLIPADLPQTRTTGLVLLDKELQPVVSTPGLPEIITSQRAAAQLALKSGEPQLSDLRLDSQDRAVVAFAVPVSAVLGAKTSRPLPVGVLLGIRNADRELLPLLHQGGSFAEHSEALLLERRDDTVVYLSPGEDGTKPTRRILPLSRPDLGAAHAVTEPGGFGQYNNYRGDGVLQVSRRLEATPWILVQQVDASQALKESNEHTYFLVISLSLLLLAVAALAVAAWRHGSSVRAQQQAHELREKALKLQKQTELLHAVTDNIDTLTLLLSRDRHILFGNRAAAEAAGSTLQAVIGNPLAATLGQAVARELDAGIEAARTRDQAVWRVISLPIGEQSRVYRAGFIPVARIGRHEQPLLLVLTDITSLQQIQQRHANLLRSLVSTLVHVVDLHDPYSAHHSQRMAEVANAIGRELRLDKAQRQALDLAATLANLGKIMIPRQVLVKSEPLTEAEQTLLKTHVPHTLELLESLDFEGPVLETIAQKQELLDGSGYPRGLTADEMTLTGKILSVANAFVALTSTRAYREGMSAQAAVNELMQLADRHYERRVVAALFHIVENRGDWLANDA
jgi:HD-GYP domain-containing protein (c-di-GMP phosphodiesterase class II)